MSTTPDPTPLDETPLDASAAPGSPLDPSPLDAGPLDPTPVDPTLAGVPEPGPGDVPPVDPAVSAPASSTKPSRAELAAARRESDLKALYAFAGFTELAVGAVRSTVTDTSRWANARLAELRLRREELAKQAEDVRKIAEGMPEDVKAAPEAARGRVAELQDQATTTYGDLANRGQRALIGVRSDVTNRIDPVFDKIQERIDAARRALKTQAATTPVPAPVTDPVVDAPLAEATGSVADEPVVEEIVVDEVVLEAEPRHEG